MNDTIAPTVITQAFVYGTLRPRCGNDRLWQDRATARHDGECFVLGHKLVTRGWFPYLVPAVTAQTIGALIVPHPGQLDEVLARMDILEGVPHHYERTTIAVLTPDGIERAWTYVPTDPSDWLLPEVPTNEGRYDWKEFRRAHRQ